MRKRVAHSPVVLRVQEVFVPHFVHLRGGRKRGGVVIARGSFQDDETEVVLQIRLRDVFFVANWLPI